MRLSVSLGLPMGSAGCISPRQQVDDLTIRLGDGIADNHLALVVAANDAEYTAEGFERGTVDQRVIFHNETRRVRQ